MSLDKIQNAVQNVSQNTQAQSAANNISSQQQVYQQDTFIQGSQLQNPQTTDADGLTLEDFAEIVNTQSEDLEAQKSDGGHRGAKVYKDDAGNVVRLENDTEKGFILKRKEHHQTDSVWVDNNGEQQLMGSVYSVNGEIKNTTNYQYDDNGNLSKEIYTEADGFQSTKDFVYDDNGVVLGYTEKFDNINTKLEGEAAELYPEDEGDTYYYDYDENGKRTGEFKDLNSDGILDSYTVYNYNNTGSTVEFIDEGGDGLPDRMKETRVEDNNDTNPNLTGSVRNRGGARSIGIAKATYTSEKKDSGGSLFGMMAYADEVDDNNTELDKFEKFKQAANPEDYGAATRTSKKFGV